MTEHEKRIREALEALPIISEWSSDELGVWMVDDPFDTFICAAEDPQEATFIAACNPAAIRAIFADLDAMREKAARYDYLSERFVGADFDWNESGTQVLVFEVEPGTQVWATADKTIDGAIASLKGATA